jgi:hypothetical protein
MEQGEGTSERGSRRVFRLPPYHCELNRLKQNFSRFWQSLTTSQAVGAQADYHSKIPHTQNCM